MSTSSSYFFPSSAPADDKQCDVFCLIWLDGNTDAPDVEQKLRSIINYLKRFQDVKSCQKYIEQSTANDRIVLIVSGSLGKQIVPTVQAIHSVASIYVYCMNTELHRAWADNFKKVKAVLDDLDELVKRIAKDHHIQKKVNEPLAFDVFSAGQSTSGVNGQFVFFQVLFDCLLRLKANTADKAELISCCKKEYEGNHSELANLREFEKSYRPEKVLRWYTKDSFFYKSMNAALRRQNMHMIFLFREFIADIQEQLRTSQANKELKVYRGQMMAGEELDRLKRSIGQLISINSFFSTSTNYDKVYTFLNVKSDLERVLFEIKAEPSAVGTKPFADISPHSEYPHEAEVLFMIGSIFRLQSIEQNERRVWVVRMALSSEEEHGLKEVLAYMKSQMPSGETNLRTLANVFWKMGKFIEAETYLNRLLDQLTDSDPLAGEIYEDLARLAGHRGDYDLSVKYQQKALQLKGPKETNETSGLDQARTAMTSSSLPKASQETSSGATQPTDVQQFKEWFERYVKQNVKALAQQSSAMKRHPLSVENFCYIIESPCALTTEEQQALRALINLGFTFSDVNGDECIKLFRSIQNERIILILSAASMANLAKAIREEPFLSAIYVVDANVSSSFDSPMYRGSFMSIARLCRQLEQDLPVLAYDLTITSSIPADYARMSTFNYVQALRDVLLESDETSDPKKDMLDFCREKYADNAVQLRFIDEFRRTFQSEQAAHWYARQETFVYKMLTRAIRIMDAEILYKLRYFIQHLHRQVESSSDTSPSTVYRTVRVRKDLFGKMKSYEGGLLSFNEFFMASRSRSTREPCPMNTASKLVHFEMRLGAGMPRLAMPNKSQEVLLTFGTAFRIGDVASTDGSDDTFKVTLVTDNDVLKSARTISKELREAIRGPFPLVRMVKLLRQKDKYDELEVFAALLMDDPRTTKDKTAATALGGALHSLGGNCYETKQYDQGLVHLQNSLKVYLSVLPPDNIRLTPTYNNIGSIYHRQDLNEKALEYHMKAYDIQKNSPNPDMDSVAAYVGNIAGVLSKLGRHREALRFYEIDLQIYQKRHADKETGDLAVKYHNIAGRQYRLEMYAEALTNYEKCLAIELEVHSADNPTVGVTYHNMGTALDKLGRFKEAMAAVEKAIERLRRTKGEDDENVQMNRKYLKQIEQRSWMKNLFADQ